LTPCAVCQRHVFSSEDRCPFCDQPIAAPAIAPRPLPRMSRAAHLAWKVALGGAGLAACSAPASPPKGAEAVAVATDASADAPLADAGADVSTDSAAPDAEARNEVHGIAIYGSNRIIITQNFRFAPHSDALPKESSALLDEVAELLKKMNLRVVLEGNADKS